MATAVLTSAAPILSLLDEPDDRLKVYALNQLNSVVDTFWAEIATVIPKIECLYEDEDFQDRNLAAVVASKVFYHLEELDDALKYALGAGDLFQVTEASEYVETLIAKCLDRYVELMASKYEDLDGKAEEVDARLIAVVERMFERCYRDGKYKQALGIAFESRKIDRIKLTIETNGVNKAEMLDYCFNLCRTTIDNRKFRQEVLTCLVDMYRSLEEPDYLNMSQCLLFLDDAASVAEMLNSLLKQDGQESALICYQVAFDLFENQNQPFLNRVVAALPVPPIPESVAATPTEAEAKPDEPTAMDTSEDNKEIPEVEDCHYSRWLALKKILSGTTPINLYLHFLYEHNNTDLNILKQLKEKLEPRNSVTHSATVMAHAFMHVGTTIDTFLRDNLEWLCRATNWAKFTATASIGVIHKGHHEESLKLLDPYLPSEGQTGSPYQEGGALYALGLIHGNHSPEKVEYLSNALKNAGSNEVVQHGGCLGLGLAAMATQNEEVYEILKNLVFTESAVAGQAAGMAMGMVLLGSGNGEALEEMLHYAHDTQHAKIIRGLALGMALILYGREEQADTAILQMITDKDPIIRFGGMHAIAMAYVGTANNSAIKKLLHVAVSDVSDDVRRAAVTALGFVLCNVPNQVPRIVSLLAESYNPHVRYGSCLAVGIACAGTGSDAAMALLEPLTKDPVDFVRQSAYIGLSMVLIQHNDAKEPKTEFLRKAFVTTLSSKGDTMTKMGAILGAGILDAGGRNVTISLLSPAGHKKMTAIVGMMMFPQFWFWYPCVHFLSLTFTPTAIIGLNKNLKMPQPFKFVSNSRPSQYAYPAPIEINKEEKKVTVVKATLSVTAKAKARAKKKGGAEMEVEEEPKEEKTEEVKEEEKPMEEEEKPVEVKEEVPELDFEECSNPSRVTWQQQKTLSYSIDQRYIPVKKTLTSGIIMLKDNEPEKDEIVVSPKAPKMGVPGVDADEPEPPADFEFVR